MTLTVKTQSGSYPIHMGRGFLSRVGEFFPLNRKCMIVTDEQIPHSFVDEVKSACGEAYVLTLPAGEGTKTLPFFEKILEEMLEIGFTRTDCLIALGGGVIGDLAGFAASAFLRGIDFYNIPTTLLSQVDSSVGGKVAVNFKGLKNMVGAFYPPKGVLIDPDTLKTLPRRLISEGLAESVKMALTSDASLFSLFEEKKAQQEIDLVIEKSIRIKAQVVEEDEKEKGLRKILNFGHTLAHAIESESLKTGFPLFHGESVALGMIPMCSPAVRARLLPVLASLGLPTRWEGKGEDLLGALSHDKKLNGGEITLIRVDEVGSFRMETMPFSAFAEEVKEGLR